MSSDEQCVAIPAHVMLCSLRLCSRRYDVDVAKHQQGEPYWKKHWGGPQGKDQPMRVAFKDLLDPAVYYIEDRRPLRGCSLSRARVVHRGLRRLCMYLNAPVAGFGEVLRQWFVPKGEI